MSKAKYAKAVKIVYTILMILMLLSVANHVFASETGVTLTPGDLTGSADQSSTDSVKNLGNQIIGIVTMVGIVVSVLVLVILGIKYMIGSAQEKAEYKKTMIPYLVGAILVFAASTIATVAMNVAEGLKTVA